MFLPGTHFCTIFISYLLLPFYPNFLTFVGNTHTKSFFFIWNLAFRLTSNNFPFKGEVRDIMLNRLLCRPRNPF